MAKLPQTHDEVPKYREECEKEIRATVAAHAAKHDLPYLLVQMRAQIVETDAQLVALLRRRVCLVEAAAVAKALAGMPVHDPGREADLVRNMAPNEGPVQRAYQEVIRVCREHAQARNGEAPVPPAPDDGAAKDAPERA
jgi:chorismate mutase